VQLTQADIEPAMDCIHDDDDDDDDDDQIIIIALPTETVVLI